MPQYVSCISPVDGSTFAKRPVASRTEIAAALNTDFMGLQAQDLNLVTAVLVAFALLVPAYKRKLAGLLPRRRAESQPVAKEAQ